MSYRGITLQQIEYFLSVAENLSFTEAAKRLYTSQPSLSRQILRMEEQLGVSLFVRAKKAVYLTAEGVKLYNQLAGITVRIDHALSSCKVRESETDLTLTIGCYDAMDTGLFLNDAIQAFKASHPGVNILIERHSFKVLRNKLLSGEIDALFTFEFEVEGLQNVIYEPVARHEASIIMPVSHSFADKQDIKLEDFRDDTFVMLNPQESPNGYKGILDMCRHAGFIPKKILHVANAESVILTVESGQGVAILDHTARIFRQEKFRKHQIEDGPVNSVIAWSSSNRNPALALFYDFVIMTFKGKQ